MAAGYIYMRWGSFALNRIASPDADMHTDFQTFWNSARRLLHGGDIYTPEPLPNLEPPVFTLMMAPLGRMEYWQAYRLFVLIDALAVVGSVTLVAAQAQLSAGRTALVTAAILASSPMLATLGLGQMYPLITLGLAVTWCLQQRGRPLLAAVVLGLVVALKPSLLPVLGLPAVRRQWQPLLVAFTSGAAAMLLGWWAAGPRSLPRWVGLLYDHPPNNYWDNASLPGMFLRLTAGGEDGARPLYAMPGGFVTGLVLGLTVLAGTLWTVRARPHGSGGDGDAGKQIPLDTDVALWAVAAAALLASPLSWHNYLVMLMPGLVVLAAHGRWRWVMALLAPALIGMEWPMLWTDNAVITPTAPQSLYSVILLGYWLALVLPLPITHSERSTEPTATGPTINAQEVARNAGVSPVRVVS